ncbi:unnamed protein product [Ectocarpus fasciculatus]
MLKRRRASCRAQVAVGRMQRREQLQNTSPPLFGGENTRTWTHTAVFFLLNTAHSSNTCFRVSLPALFHNFLAETGNQQRMHTPLHPLYLASSDVLQRMGSRR